MNADGSAMRAVTSRGLDERASFLPDGRILYYRGSSHSWVVANPDATHIRSTAIHQRWASLCVFPNGNRIALRRHLRVNETLSALFVGRLFGGRDRLTRITRYQRMDQTIDWEQAPGMLMGSVTVVITLLMLGVIFFDHPHGGGVGRLQPTAMERALRLIDAELNVIALDVTPPCDERGVAR